MARQGGLSDYGGTSEDPVQAYLDRARLNRSRERVVLVTRLLEEKARAEKAESRVAELEVMVAQAWDEGYKAAQDYLKRSKGHWDGDGPVQTWVPGPVPPNPYRRLVPSRAVVKESGVS